MLKREDDSGSVGNGEPITEAQTQVGNATAMAAQESATSEATNVVAPGAGPLTSLPLAAVNPLAATATAPPALAPVGQVIEGVLARPDLDASTRKALSKTALRHAESGTLDRPVAGSMLVPVSIQTAKSQHLVMSVAPDIDALPPLTEAEKAHERILKRLHQMQLRERKVS
jgi:hypothetical protein